MEIKCNPTSGSAFQRTQESAKACSTSPKCIQAIALLYRHLTFSGSCARTILASWYALSGCPRESWHAHAFVINKFRSATASDPSNSFPGRSTATNGVVIDQNKQILNRLNRISQIFRFRFSGKFCSPSVVGGS